MIHQPQHSYTFYDFYNNDKLIGHCFLAPSIKIIELTGIIVSPFPKTCSKILCEIITRIFYGVVCIMSLIPAALLIPPGLIFKGIHALINYAVKSCTSNNDEAPLPRTPPNSSQSSPERAPTINYKAQKALKEAERILKLPKTQSYHGRLKQLIKIKTIMSSPEICSLDKNDPMSRAAEVVIQDSSELFESQKSKILTKFNEIKTKIEKAKKSPVEQLILVCAAMTLLEHDVEEQLKTLQSDFKTSLGISKEIKEIKNELRSLYYRRHQFDPHTREIAIPDEGNCLFQSFLEGHRWIKDHEKTRLYHHQVRLNCVKWMRDNINSDLDFRRILVCSIIDDLEKQKEKLSTELSESSNKNEELKHALIKVERSIYEMNNDDQQPIRDGHPLKSIFDDYFNKMSQDKVWGNLAETYALSYFYKVCIVIVNTDLIINSQYPDRIYLKFNKEKQHYTTYIPDPTSSPNSNFQGLIPPH